jgi:hypothetical protein
MTVDWAVVFMFAIAVPLCAWAFWLVTNDERRKPSEGRRAQSK